MDREKAGDLLRAHLREGESAKLEWSETRLAVASNRGLDRTTEATRVEIEVRCNGGGYGSAASAARRLGSLDVKRVFDRARHRTASGEEVEPDGTVGPLALSPEAVARLVAFVNRVAFTARAFERGESLLCRYRGVQVFDRGFEITDDATDASGMPFPFDQEGSVKRPVPLVERGVPRTPALDHLHAHLLGLDATAHATSVDDALAEHLFVGCGDLSPTEILEVAEGGVWASEIAHLECYEPDRLRVRVRLRGARRVEGGRLGRALPELAWETSLLEAFGRLRGVGREPVLVTVPGSLLGGVSAPAVVFESERLSAA